MIPCLQAQTWNGNSSNDWFTAANWTPATVPGAASNVTIPGSLINYPVLTADVSIQNLTMTTGSALHLNGHAFTGSGTLSLNGATIDGGGAFSFDGGNPATVLNSALTATLSLTNKNNSIDFQTNSITGNTTISTASTANYTHYIGGNNFNGNLTITHGSAAGGNTFLEGYGQSDTVSGNVVINVTSTSAFYVAYNDPIQVGGNFTFNRTTNGNSYIFNAGASNIGGNLAFSSSGGVSDIGNNANTATIAGTINMTAGTGDLEIRKIKNGTAGGSVNVTAPNNVLAYYDTLLANVSLTAIAGELDFEHNSITGNTSINTDVNANIPQYMGDNLFTGNLSITHGGTAGGATFLESYGSSDVITGNVTVSVTCPSTFYVAYNARIQVGGNFTFNRTTAGTSDIFNAGTSLIGGNFSFSSNGGNTTLGNSSNTAAIAGTVNMTAAAGNLGMRRIKNGTAGGTISWTSPGTVLLYNDTLLADVSITGTSNSFDIEHNSITGNTALSTDVNANTPQYMGDNLFTGNLSITHGGTAGGATFEEGYGNSDVVTGNVVINVTSPSAFYVAYNDPIQVGGNFTFNRTTNGNSYIFNAGASAISGNFTFSSSGGISDIGNSGQVTQITGTVNLTAGTGNVEIRKIKNGTAGGSVTVTAPNNVLAYYDTLQANVSVTGITGELDFEHNSITGNTTLQTNNGTNTPHYVGDNFFNGNLSLIHSATAGGSTLLESYGAANTVAGKDSIVITNGAPMTMGYSAPHIARSHFITNANSGLTITRLTLAGADSAYLRNYGAQPLSVATLVVNRSSGVPAILNTPLTLTTTLTLTNGYLKSSLSNPFIFSSNIGYTGGSDASHLIGAIQRTGTTAFTFPLGNGQYYSPIGITAPGSGTHTFQAQYSNTDPQTAGYDTAAHDPGLDHVSHTEYWLLDQLAGSASVKVTLGWGSSSGGVPVPADLRVAHWNGSLWLNEGNGAFIAYADSGTVQSANNIAAFSPFTLASVTPANPLPLRLISFEAYNLKPGTNRLEWQTAEEEAQTVFEVEKSTNGRNFETIAIVTGQGTQGSRYLADDGHLLQQNNYYRLKIKDATGSMSYSQVVRVSATLPYSGAVQAYPVPANDRIVVTNVAAAANGSEALVQDAQGRVVFRFTLQSKVEINTANWPAGIYTLRTAEGQALRLVKQ